MGRKRQQQGQTEANLNEKPKAAGRQLSNDPAPSQCPQGLWPGEPCWPMAAVVFVLILAVYVETMPPSIVGGDNSELVNAACTAGVAHPPGYPLLTMLGALVGRAGDKEGIAWRLNVLNAVLGAASAGLVFLTARMRHLGGSDLAAGVAALLFGLHPIQWQYHVHYEVFALNNLLVTLAVMLGIIFVGARTGNASLRVACAGAFVCGIGLSNQHTVALFIVPVATCVLWRLFSEGKLTPRSLLLLTLSAAAGLLPYAYLPLASYGNPSGSWGDQTTLQGFLTHFFRKEYGTLRLYGGFNKLVAGQTFLQGISLHLWNVVETTGYVGALFPILGALLGLPMALQTTLLASGARACSLFKGQCGTGGMSSRAGGSERAGGNQGRRQGQTGSGSRGSNLLASGAIASGGSAQLQGRGGPSSTQGKGKRSETSAEEEDAGDVGLVRARLAYGDVHAQVASVRLLLLLFVTYNGVFHFLSNVPLDNHLLLGVQKRFWMQSNILVALLAAAGLSAFRKLCLGPRADASAAAPAPDVSNRDRDDISNRTLDADASKATAAKRKAGNAASGHGDGDGAHEDNNSKIGSSLDDSASEADTRKSAAGEDEAGGIGGNGAGASSGTQGQPAERRAGVARKGAGKMVAFDWAIVLALAAVLAGARIPAMKESDNWHMWRYGRTHLDSLPENAMLIVWGDIQQFTLGYHQRCQGYRTDVRLYDLAMGSYIWYKPKQHPNLPGVVMPGRMYHPRNDLDYNLKQLLDANIGSRPVYMLQWFDKDSSANSHYDLIPYGMVQRVVPKGGDVTMDYQAWFHESTAAEVSLDALPPIERYDRASWEHVLSTEVCNMHFEWAKFALTHLAHAPEGLRIHMLNRAIRELEHPRVYLWWDYRPFACHMFLGFAYQQRYNNFKNEADKDSMLEYYRRFMVEAPADDSNRGQVAAVLEYYGKPVPAGRTNAAK
eukprot:jgi/Mesvir1/16533/Mv10077-RA.2